MKYLSTKALHPLIIPENMDRFFNHFFDDSQKMESRGFRVDISESDDGYEIQADLPGFAAADVNVRVENGLLVIEAGMSVDSESNDETWHVRERLAGKRKRSFVLPKELDTGSVEAEMKNGVLSVMLKKKPEAKPLSVEVRGN